MHLIQIPSHGGTMQNALQTPPLTLTCVARLPLTFLCHPAQNLLQFLSWTGKKEKDYKKLLYTHGSLTVANQLFPWFFKIHCTHLFILWNLDFPYITHIQNTSECHTLCWSKPNNLLLQLCSAFSYTVTSFCILVGTGKIPIHYLDSDSDQLKLRNTRLKFCILKHQLHKHNISTTVSLKSIWSCPTECYVDFFPST